MQIIIELAGAAVLVTVVGVGTYKILEWIRRIRRESEKEAEHEDE